MYNFNDIFMLYKQSVYTEELKSYFTYLYDT